MVFHADESREQHLNPTGLFVWRMLDGRHSEEHVASRMAEEFEGASGDEILPDVRAFITDLQKQDYVQPVQHAVEGPLQVEPFPDQGDAPTSVDISLTGKCNLRCAYCFYHDEMESRPDLPKEAWLAFFEELGRLGVKDVTLSGGEVFVRPDLWELIDGVIANRMRYSLNTNGTLINEKTLQSFEQGKRRNRLNSIQVSIDGSRPEVHDKSRGKGTFKKAIRGLRMFKETGFPVTVRVTVNRHNIDDLENTAQLLLEDVGIQSVGTNDAMPMGAGCENQPAIALTPQQQVQAMQILARLAEAYNGRITATAGPLAKWRMYREMEHARATGEKPTRWKMGYLTACGCMYNKLSVHHDGMITPCNMLAKLEMGRIHVDSFREIWQSHPMLKTLKERRNIPMTQVPGCEDCEWAEFCNGSCPGLAYEMTGDFNHANPHDCYQKFLQETGIKTFLDTNTHGFSTKHAGVSN